MIYKPYKNIFLSRLGLGNMRFPTTDKEGQHIDYEKAHAIIDAAFENGINYFDTAHVYNNTDSESCLGECMKKYPRDKFYLATKYNIGAEKDYKGMFEAQLKRLQTDHIDFYLIHCLMDSNIEEYLNSGCIEYFLEMQKQGKITYLGFSSHASTKTLERFADHHQWDFAQIQLNYYDWHFGATEEEYNILTKRNIPIMVMEPVRGGKLSTLTPDAEELLKKSRPDASISSWAFNFVKTLPNVLVVLSGMNDMSQIEDNIKTFSTTDSLSPAEIDILMEAIELFKKQYTAPCTSCRYCTPNCPMKINIPEYLRVYNKFKLDGAWALGETKWIQSDGTPADCIMCGSCMNHCPQSINIPKYLKELAEAMEK